MNLLLIRKYLGPKYTIGKLFVEDRTSEISPLSDVLEDVVRDFGKHGEGKIKKHTAIPYGTYELKMTYSPRFKQMMPTLLNVPYYSRILIHDGIDQNSTEGCLIVGFNKQVGKVLNGKPILRLIQDMLTKAELHKEKSYITIK